jgi:hypothetical protein
VVPLLQKESLTARTLSSRSTNNMPAMLFSKARWKRCSLFASASAPASSVWVGFQL